MGFIHLHVHSEYSFLDGLMKIKELVAKAKSLNMKAIALTDHNHIGGCYEFFNECRKENIKPILGVETYWTHDTNILSLPNNERKKIAKAKFEELYTKEEIKAMKSEDKKEILKSLEYDNKQYHLLLLAKNDKGFKDIIRLQEKASEKCTYNGRYLVDDEMLKEYVTENIIATTACIGSIISNLVSKNKLEEAEEQLLKWKEIFKDNLYLEMQPLLIEQQINTNKFYIKMHLKHNIPLVATTDVHYANYEDHDDHDKLMCIGMGKMFDDKNRMRYENEFWLKSANEMRESFERQTLLIDEDDREEYFEHCRQAINNTLHINNLITDDYVLGSDVPVYPNVDLKENETPESKLRLESYSGLYKYLSKQKKAGHILDRHTYECRLNHELNIINKKGYAPYFLVVKDFIGYCDSHDIPTGPGRGSAAGALTLLCNNITKIIDPIQHNLLFERFLTADRTSPPDIDSDFSYYKRGEVIKYLQNKYGAKCVSNIGTYMEIGVKTAIKDIGKSANYSFAEMNELTKLIDKWTEENPSPTFEMLDELKNSISPQDIKYYTEFKAMEQKYSEVFRLARRFEGIKKTFGSHASGILITPFEISSILPVRVHEGRHITMYTGEQLESLNFIKFDILGLKTLDILQKTINQIDNNMKLTDLYEKVAEHFNDKKMYSLLAEKKTDCVFQLESNMFKGLCSEINISDFGDIVATTAVGRPGPLSAGLNERYAKRKNGKEVSVDPLPNLDDLLSDTYGCIIYQENIMQIAKKVAKVNNNQADSLFRKAIAKKKADLFEICKRVFIYGKKNCEAPAGNDNTSGIYYDPKAKYGDEILGGINNGYEEKELINFMEELKGYSSYLFNKSHAATYSFISLCTLYLKKYYPLEYYASYLSVKSNEIEKMLNLFRKEKIVLLTPDINLSKEDYSVKNKKSKQILMGLCSIKGFGEIPMQTILSRRPFKSLDEVLAIEKGLLNKKAITGLISSGATDELEPNRYKALNMLLDNRKAKDERYNEDSYTKASTRALEKEYLEIALTNPSFWNLVETNKLTNVRLVVLDKTERPDKNNNMMANITVQIDEDIVEGLVFAKCYCQNHDIIIPGKSLYVKAKKDDKDKILINSIIEGAV